MADYRYEAIVRLTMKARSSGESRVQQYLDNGLVLMLGAACLGTDSE